MRLRDKHVAPYGAIGVEQSDARSSQVKRVQIVE